MSLYLYPEMKSKKAYKDALKEGRFITGSQPGPFGKGTEQDGTFGFEGPHYPKPHRYYGSVTIKNGQVVSVK